MTHEKELESSILAWNDPLMNECFREPTEELNEWWIRRVGIGTNEAKAVVAGLGAHLRLTDSQSSKLLEVPPRNLDL